MKQKNFTLSHHLIKTAAHSGWSGHLSKLVALVLLVAASLGSYTVRAQAYGSNDITIAASPTGGTPSATTYYGNAGTTTTPKFDGAQIANNAVFSQATGSLILTAANTRFRRTDNTTPVITSQLQYRVYSTDAATIPGYSILNLQNTSADNFTPIVVFSSPGTNGAPGTTSIDLLNQPAVLGAGSYIVDIVYVSTYSDGGVTTTLNDPTNTSAVGYRATFRVSAPAVTPTNGRSTWVSQQSTDWTLAANWSNGVPTATSDAIIPGHDDSDPFTVSPVLVARTAPYSVRTLTLQNSSNPVRATMRVNPGATLAVYGDLNQAGGGLDVSSTTNSGIADPNSNSTIIFAGIDQVIRGTLNGSDVIVAGSGTKSVVDALNAFNTLTLVPQSATVGVLIQSATESTNGSGATPVVTFDTSLNKYINLGSTGTLFGETNVSYVRGVLKADRTLGNGSQQTFGNIGLDITPNRDITNTTLITRVLGAALTGPTGTSAKPIKRQFIVNGDINNGTTVDLVFHYLDSPDELNGIKEENLQLFRTVTGAAPYTNQYGTEDASNNILTRFALTGGIYTVTLGDKTNPLPVSLVAFAAVRNAANTLLSWTTALEQNNKGFNVQVSADGVTYRTLAFIASKSPNSSNELNYKYTDVEVGKAGIRYYRLEQVDEDGKLNYSPVRAVGFDGAAATSVALVAYPNPFSDTIGLTVEGATTTEGAAYVKLVDMTGRTVLDQKVSLNGASLTLGDVSGLRSGLYLANVTLPDGTIQTVRVQKQ